MREWGNRHKDIYFNRMISTIGKTKNQNIFLSYILTQLIGLCTRKRICQVAKTESYIVYYSKDYLLFKTRPRQNIFLSKYSVQVPVQLYYVNTKFLIIRAQVGLWSFRVDSYYKSQIWSHFVVHAGCKINDECFCNALFSLFLD